MKLSRVLVPPSAAVLLAAATLLLSGSSRAEIVERIVAKVNGDIVTQSEFEARQLAAVQAARVAPSEIERYLRQNNQRILQEAVDDLLIVQRAGELGIRLRPEYVVDIIEGIKKENNIADDAELRSQLRREGMSLDDLKRNIERSVLRRQALSRELEPKTAVTDADVRAEYEGSKADYTRSASVHLQEIVVPDAAQAEDVVRRARGGEDFGTLARVHSTAGSRATGGDLGKVARGDMNPALETIVSALPAGGVSDPIPTENGFRIVRVVAKEESKVTPFDEVKDEIKNRLAQQRMASAYEAYVEGLREASRKTTLITVSEVSVDVPDLPASTLTTPGLTAPAAAPVPALPGIDASEISTTPQARPERVAPPEVPERAAPPPSPSPAPPS
ncbi:MAG TPA: peptidyl-prolyl cis-trans isomerase [Vicinamibacteria bacterium]|nr:peptidyl-prolyl cis-trans isomerase [Vicinamibacteria bacterium]